LIFAITTRDAMETLMPANTTRPASAAPRSHTADIDLLRVFDTLVRIGSFTTAAKALSRTQSAVSMQLRRLEDQLGVQLVTRGTRQLAPTPEGLQLLPLVRQMLGLNDQLFHDVGAQEVSGNIRLGSIEHYATRVLPVLVAEFCRQYPRIHVELHHGVSSAMHTELGALSPTPDGRAGGLQPGSGSSRTPAPGLTVGIVALPLAMAFAIASGLKPEAGIWTAIIAGFLISALGGSAVQIGGPAGAFIVIVYGILERYGLANLLIATACAGVLLFAAGLFGWGGWCASCRCRIVVGFTNGIAVLILLSQLKDLLGPVGPKMPADLFSQLQGHGAAPRHLQPLCASRWAWPAAGPVCLAAAVRGRWAMRLIRMVQAARACSSSAHAHGLAHAGADRRAGHAHACPGVSRCRWRPSARASAASRGRCPASRCPIFRGRRSSCWSRPPDHRAARRHRVAAVRARGRPGLSGLPRHDPNQELMAQGIANFVVPFFGGMPATGTIARTVTNIRSGGSSPVAGIVHALTLMVVVLLAAPLARHVPLAVLAGILLFVA
jgi:hypothetical protein